MYNINGDFARGFLQFISHPAPRNPQTRIEVSIKMVSQKKRIGGYESSGTHKGVDPHGFPEKRNGEQMRQRRIQMAF